MFEWIKKYKVAVVIGCILLVLIGVFFWGYYTGRKVRLGEVADEAATLRKELSAIKAGVGRQGEVIRALQAGIEERDGLTAERERIAAERENLERERQDITESLKSGELRTIELIDYGESISRSLGDEIQCYLDGNGEPAESD